MFTLSGSLLNTQRIDAKYSYNAELTLETATEKKKINLEAILEFLTHLTIFKIGYMFKHYNTFLKG